MIMPVCEWYLVGVGNDGTEATVLSVPDTYHWIESGARIIIDPAHLKESHPKGKFIHRNYILGVISD